MIFDRVKPLDAILATAEKKGLQRTLGAFQLTMLGIGAIIGTGIFVLTAEAGQKAGPAMMIAFVIAAIVCALAALAYSELASMIPVSGSAYTYTYGVMGEGPAGQGDAGGPRPLGCVQSPPLSARCLQLGRCGAAGYLVCRHGGLLPAPRSQLGTLRHGQGACHRR